MKKSRISANLNAFKLLNRRFGGFHLKATKRFELN